MKKTVFFELLSFCLLVTPVVSLGANNNGWESRPLMKRSTGKQEPTKNSENAPKKSRLKKNDIAWYKKPAAQYAAGGLLSVAVGAYALFRYMQGEVAIPVTEDKVAAEVVDGNNSTDTSGEKKVDNTLPVNTEVLTDKKELTAEEIATANRKNHAHNMAVVSLIVGVPTVLTAAGIGIGQYLGYGTFVLVRGFFGI